MLVLTPCKNGDESDGKVVNVAEATPSRNHSAELTVAEALQLRPVAHGMPVLLTPSARQDRAVRWVHIIGQDRPGTMLQGGELILSTLPRLSEDRTDLLGSLHDYLADLDDIAAAALAVEVLPNRPRLLAALKRVAAERESRPDARELVPLLLFNRVVRFVEVTESLHRDLVSRQLGRPTDSAPPWDPLVSATTNLLDDLAAPGGLPRAEVEARAAALGMPPSASYCPMAFCTSEPIAQPDSQRTRVLATLIRETATTLRLPTLVGVGSEGHVFALLAESAPEGKVPRRGLSADTEAAEQLCRAVREDVVRRRTREPLPRYTAACGVRNVQLHQAPKGLKEAADIAFSAILLMGRFQKDQITPQEVPNRGYWRAADIGLRGLLVQLAESPASSWFRGHHLGQLTGPDVAELRKLAHAAVQTDGNKSELARHLGMSRPTVYSRLERFERALGGPLEGDRLTAVYIALLLEELNPEVKE